MSPRAGLAAALVLVCACTSPCEPSPAPATAASTSPAPPPPPAPDPAARSTAPAGADAMIDTLRDLARLFAAATITQDELTRRLGPPAGPPPPKGIALKLAPTDPRFTRVRVATDASTDAIYMLDLDLADGARPTVGALRAAFGAPRTTTPSALGAIPELRFDAPDAGTPIHVSLAARLADGARGADGDAVMSVSLTREAKRGPGE